MKKIFKCKNLFLVTFLAIAGFFSAGAFVVNKQTQETPVVEKVEATDYDTAPLFYVPNNTWKSNNYSDLWFDPYLYMEFEDGTSYGSYVGTRYNNIGIFYNVPLKKPSLIKIQFHHQLSGNNDPRIFFNTTAKDEWFDGNKNSKNIFGSKYDGWYNNNPSGGESEMVSDSYSGNSINYYEGSKLCGSVVEDSNFNWTVDAIPRHSAGFCYNYHTEKYEITVDFWYGDEIRFVYFTCTLNNTSSNGNASSWSFNVSWSEWQSYGTYTVYDENKGASTQTVSNYIDQHGDNTRILHSGRVTISISSARSTTATFTWKSSPSRTFTPSTSLPNYAAGSFGDWNTSLDEIKWNPYTGRFETIVAVVQNERFKFYGGGWASIGSLTNITSSGATLTGGGSSDWTITSSTGYYAIGWFYYNSNAGGSATRGTYYFVDYNSTFLSSLKASTSSTLTANALSRRVSAIKTCNCNKTDATNLSSLFASCNTSTKTTVMSGYTFKDYDYNEYKSQGNYDGLTKKNDTNAYYKYQWIQYYKNDGSRPAGLGNFDNLFPMSNSEDNSSIILIIVASSISILSITALSILLVKKRKSKEQ